jgi:hypothetical protein
MTRKVLVPLIIVLLAGALGFGLGYFGAVAGAVSQMPLFQQGRTSAVGFDREFDDFSRLGALENVAACGDSKSVSKALEGETDLLHGMQERSASHTTPLLLIAEARLIVRKAMATERDPLSKIQPETGKQEASRVEILLKGAGWQDASESHLREVIRALDDDQCRKNEGTR